MIVGGGLAGLAAASSLVKLGLRITLLESRPRLGGRASSFTDPVTGEPVDNCQHVSMACCTNLADFCHRVGTADLFRREPEVVFLGPEGRISRLAPAAARSAPPLRQLPAGELPDAGREKLRVAYGLACLALDARRPARRDVRRLAPAATARRSGRSTCTGPPCSSRRSTSGSNRWMSATPARSSSTASCATAMAIRWRFPLVPLGELYGTRLEGWLGDNGVTVRLTTGRPLG